MGQHNTALQTYIFASVRGSDFEIDGTSPEDAYLNLQHREDGEGTLWRLNDDECNRYAVKNRGFSYLCCANGVYIAFKEKN